MSDKLTPQGAILREILDVYATLPPSERKVADEILANPRDVVYMTAQDLARVANVSQPATSRLCRRLSTGTFTGFKIALAQQTGELPPSNDTDARSERHGGDFVIDDPDLALLVDTERDLLAATLRAVATLDPAAMRSAARALADARTVLLCGFDMSGSVAWRLASLLRLEGIRARPEYDYQTLPSISELTVGDTLVVISYRGSTPSLRGPVASAQQRGAKVLLITNEAHFNIGAEPDVVLLTHAPSASTEELYVAGPALQIQLAVIRTLWGMTRTLIQQRSASDD